MLLVDIAADVKRIYYACAESDSDLFGMSLLDLCADNLPSIPLADIKSAIIVAGLHSVVNDRIKQQIASYK